MGAIIVRGDGKRIYQGIEEAEKHIHQLQAEISAMQSNQRERIATACLQGVIASGGVVKDRTKDGRGGSYMTRNSEALAEFAVKRADALIAELAKERDNA